MLPSKERLSRAQFTQFLANKGILVVYNKLGTFKYFPSSTRSISIVTSSKHEKKAVGRNTFRRRLYTLFGSTISMTGVFYAAKGSYILTYDEIKTLFTELMAKVHKNSTQAAK